MGVDRNLLEQELKLSCTNVMLQCLDTDSRCIYILGTMFRVDSQSGSRDTGDFSGRPTGRDWPELRKRWLVSG